MGPWLPEVVSIEPDPADHAELAESLTIGFLAMLERLGPTERVVFVLAEVFAVPFDEIATIVGRSPQACRQVASRARSRVREGRPRYAPTDDEAWQVATAFLLAAQVGDLESLVSLIADDALAVSDGGADHRAARRPVVAARLPRYIVNLATRVPAGARLTMQLVNGQPGLVTWVDDRPVMAMAIVVAEAQVHRLYSILNPDKLRSLTTPPT